jgi:hypothetical protein
VYHPSAREDGTWPFNTFPPAIAQELPMQLSDDSSLGSSVVPRYTRWRPLSLQVNLS